VFRLALDGVAELLPAGDVFLNAVEAEHVALDPDVVIERVADGLDDLIPAADIAEDARP
jgi:hypothetical protein